MLLSQKIVMFVFFFFSFFHDEWPGLLFPVLFIDSFFLFPRSFCLGQQQFSEILSIPIARWSVIKALISRKVLEWIEGLFLLLL